LYTTYTYGMLIAPCPPGPCPTPLGELNNAYLLHTATLVAIHHTESLQFYGLEYQSEWMMQIFQEQLFNSNNQPYWGVAVLWDSCTVG